MNNSRLFFILLFTGVIYAVFAGQPDSLSVQERSSRKVYELDKIVVTGHASAKTLGYSRKKEISSELSGGATSFSELLNGLPGLRITTSGKGESDLRIRSFFKKQVKILVNGRPLSGGYFGNVDLHTLPITDIKRINIIQGPVSSLLGANTLGGVVNIVTHDIPYGWKHTARLLIDSNSTYDLSYIGSKGNRSNGFRYSLTRSHSPGYRLSRSFTPTSHQDGGKRENTGYSRQSAGLGWNGFWGLSHNFDLQAHYIFIDNKEIPSPVYKGEYRKFTDWHNYNLSLKYSVPLKYNLPLEVTLYTDNYNNTYEEYDGPSMENSVLISELHNRTVGLSSNTEWKISGSLNIKKSYHYEYSSFKRKDNVLYPDWFTGSTVLQQISLQPEYSPASSLVIAAGAGLSSFHIDEPEYNLDLSSGLYYTSEKNLRLSAAYSRNNRYPVMHELFSINQGNPQLMPERADKLELTASTPFRIGSMPSFVHLALYRNNIYDLIEPVFDPENNTRRFQNIEEASNYGTDIDLTISPFEFWQSSISYTLILSGKQSDYSLLRIPRHNVINANRFYLTDSLVLRQTTEFCARRNDLDYYENPRQIPSYVLHHISLNKSYSKLTMTAGIDNIFDTHYSEKFGFPGKGRKLFVTLKLQL